MSGITSEEVVNALGVGEIVLLIEDENTRNSHAVIDVIHRIELIMANHRTLQRCQLVGFQAVKGLFFGWSATWALPGHNPNFGDIPKGVRKDFVLKCIEVGTAIAARQRALAMPTPH